MVVVGEDVVDRTRRGITRWCAQAGSPYELLRGVAEQVRPVVRQDAAAWLVTDPATVLFTDGYIEGFGKETCEPWFRHELSVPNVATFAELARDASPVSVLSAATGGDVTGSPRWVEVLEPVGLGRELRVVFRDHGATWGVAAVHRACDRPDFSPAETRLFASIAATVGAGLRRLVTRQQAPAADPGGPGLLIVGPDGMVRPGTDAGGRWLELFGAPRGAIRQTWLLTLGALATGGGRSARQVRMRTQDGRWATLYAEPMTDDDAFAVIVEPSRPAAIAEVVALAYGLTSREQELVLGLARGESTGCLARGLSLSPHTVRDYLKSIFVKTGVNSRTELVARLFHDHYAEPMFAKLAHHN